jgi:hypothetical protein
MINIIMSRARYPEAWWAWLALLVGYVVEMRGKLAA